MQDCVFFKFDQITQLLKRVVILTPLIYLVSIIVASRYCLPEEGPPWEFSGVRGKIKTESYLSTQRLTGLPTHQNRSGVELESKITNYTYTAKLVPYVWTEIPHAVVPRNRSPGYFFELKEGWLEAAFPDWEIRVGNQIFTWGAADRINPTDVYNPTDYYEPIWGKKLPQAGAKLKIHPEALEGWTLEIVATPFFRENRLPLDYPEAGSVTLKQTDSRWLIFLPTSVESQGVVVPLNYTLTAPTFPSKHSVGGRLSVSDVAGWDFSIYSMAGVEKNPRMAFEKAGDSNDPNLPIEITINPSFHRYQMWGFDAAGNLKVFGRDFGLRFETAFTIRDNSRAAGLQDLTKDNFIFLMAGIDHTFPENILGTVLYLNFQFAFYERMGNREQTPGQLVIQGLPNLIPWDRDLIFFVENRFSDTFKLATRGVWSFQNGDVYVNPMFHLNFLDHWNAEVGFDWFVGNFDGFFGQFKDNNRFLFALSYLF